MAKLLLILCCVARAWCSLLCPVTVVAEGNATRTTLTCTVDKSRRVRLQVPREGQQKVWFLVTKKQEQCCLFVKKRLPRNCELSGSSSTANIVPPEPSDCVAPAPTTCTVSVVFAATKTTPRELGARALHCVAVHYLRGGNYYGYNPSHDVRLLSAEEEQEFEWPLVDGSAGVTNCEVRDRHGNRLSEDEQTQYQITSKCTPAAPAPKKGPRILRFMREQ